MITAYIMIKISPGEQMNWDNIVKEKVEQVKHIEEVNHILGRHDLIAKVEMDDFKQVAGILENIRCINGVYSTETYVVHKK